MDSKPLRERDEEPRTSEENSQNRHWLRSQPGKSCEKMIQDLIIQDSDSDSGSEVPKSWEAFHNAGTSHHLQLDIEQGLRVKEKQDPATIILNNDVKITAGQTENPGSPRDYDIEAGDNGNPMNSDVIAARDTGSLSGNVSRGAVSDAISAIGDVDNLERTGLRNLNEKEKEFSGTKKSPYAFRSCKK